MAFSDPQTVLTVSLPNIEKTGKTSVYRAQDGALTLKISHSENKRNRRTVRLDFQKVAADPFEPALNQKFTGSAYLVVDAPITGFTNVELRDFVLGLTEWLDSGNILKVLGGES